MFGRLASLILRAPGAAFVSLTIVILLVFSGALKLHVEFSASAFFASDDPQSIFLEEYLQVWGEDDMLVIAIDGHGETLLDKERLAKLDELVQVVSADPEVETAHAATAVPQIGPSFAGMWIPIPLLATVPSGEAKLVAWRTRVLEDPRFVPGFFSEDGTFSAIYVQLRADTDDLNALDPVMTRVQGVIDSFSDEKMSFSLAGVPAIRAQVFPTIFGDQLTLIPIASGLMALLLLLMFRSKHGVLIPLLAAFVPLVMLLGTMGWTNEPIGLLNQTVFILIPVIAVADAIHLVNRYHEETWRHTTDEGVLDAEGRTLSIVRAMRFMGVACLLTSVTTMVGFLSLCATRMPGLRSYGLYTAVGIAFAYFTMLFIVPLALSRTRTLAKRPRHKVGFMGWVLFWFTTLTERYTKPCLFGTAAVVAVCVVAGAGVEIGQHVSQTFDEDHPITVANQMVDEQLGGVMTLEFDLRGKPGDFDRQEVLDAIADAEQAGLDEAAIKAAWGPASMVAYSSSLVGGPYEVPATSGLVERIMRLNEQTGIAEGVIDADRGRGRVVFRVQDPGAAAFTPMAKRVTQAIQARVGAVGLEANATGTSYVAYLGLSQLAVDLRNSLLVAFLVIGGFIAVLFRSIGMGLISLVPNMVPLIIGYGVMGAAGWMLEPAVAIVFTVALGIAVDCTIHVLARFTEERRRGHPSSVAIRTAVLHSGRAITVTSVILAVGFGVNAMSSFPANSVFGMLGAVMVLAALVCNLVVLPSLLHLLYRDEQVAPA